MMELQKAQILERTVYVWRDVQGLAARDTRRFRAEGKGGRVIDECLGAHGGG